MGGQLAIASPGLSGLVLPAPPARSCDQNGASYFWDQLGQRSNGSERSGMKMPDSLGHTWCHNYVLGTSNLDWGRKKGEATSNRLARAFRHACRRTPPLRIAGDTTIEVDGWLGTLIAHSVLIPSVTTLLGGRRGGGPSVSGCSIRTCWLAEKVDQYASIRLDRGHGGSEFPRSGKGLEGYGDQ